MSTDDPDPQIGEAAVLIERLARLLRASEHEEGLNPAQWEALRYLSRCNRFSNSPTALAHYLAATKGTVSQTLNALDQKGLITKQRRPAERRSVALTLTEDGWAMLDNDPIWRLAEHEEDLRRETREGLRIGLRHFVLRELAHNDWHTFGICASCRHFEARAAGAAAKEGIISQDPERPHLCTFWQVALSDEDSEQVCVEHQPPG